jgi:parallel beta-helix repeat protein
MTARPRRWAWPLAITAVLLVGALTAGILGGLAAAPGTADFTHAATAAPPFAQGGPAPSLAPPTCSGSTPFSGQIVIWPNGAVTPGGAPVSTSGTTYTLNDPVTGSMLVLDSNITVNGSECAITYTTVTGYGNSTGVEVRNATDVTAEYFHVTGSFSYGVTVDRSSAVTVYGSTLEDAIQAGVWVNLAENVNVTDNNVSYSEDGIWFESTTEGLAQDNQAVFVTDAGLYLYVCTDVAFLDNNARGALDYGAYIEYGTNSLIEDNNLSDVTTATMEGVVDDYGANDVFESNNISGQEEYGVYIETPDGSVFLENNQITGGHQYGVEVYDSFTGTLVTIAGNDLRNATDEGVYLDGSGAVTISHNDIRANATTVSDEPTGVYAYEVYGVISISDNDLSGGNYYGVDLDSEGSPMSVTDNNIENATDIGVYDQASYGLLVAGNDISVNTSTSGYGIELQNPYPGITPTVVQNNLIIGGWENAIFLYESYTSIEILHNVLANATDAGIVFYELSASLQITGNDLSANSTTGAIDDALGIDSNGPDSYLTGPVVLSYNNFANTYYGVYIPEVFGSLAIDNNSFANCSDYGVDLDSEDFYGNVTIDGNVFSQTVAADELTGADVDYVVGSLDFSNNVVTGAAYYGLYVDEGTSGVTTANNNQIDDPTGIGLSIEDPYSGAVVDGNSIVGNDTTYSAAAQGIYLDDPGGSAVTSISDNVISGGLETGLGLVEAFSSLNVVSGNDIRGTVESGIFVYEDQSPTLIADNTVSTAQGFDILAPENAALTVEDNTLRDANVSLNVSQLDGPTWVQGNNDTGSNITLELSSTGVDYLATVEGNDFTDSKAAFVNDSLDALIGNDFLRTPNVSLNGDLFDQFYHNDIWTGTGSTFDLTGSTPALGVYNAPLPTGGNYWTSYVPTSCTGGFCSPPYDVPSLGTGTGTYDEHPLGHAWFNYAVSFAETGLPSGTPWSVTVGTSVLTGVAPSDIQFLPQNVPPTVYDFAVPGVGDYSMVTPASGSFTANGTALTIDVAFALPSYPVSFNETGLDIGASWYVNSTGSPSFADHEFNVTVANSQAFSLGNLSNGTYGFSVAVHPSVYAPAAPPSGTFTVNGASVTVHYTYTLVVYAVSFTASGLASGATWTVTLGGTPHVATSATISIPETNGSYAYSVTGPTGYTLTPSSGSVTVAGGTVSVFVVGTTSSGSGTSSSSGISATEFYGLVAALIAALALAAVGWAMYARKPKGGTPASGAPPTGAGGVQPWNESGSAAPGGGPPPPPAGGSPGSP